MLFDGERLLTEWVTQAFASVPPDVPPWSTLRQAVGLVVPSLEANRADADRLASIVAGTPALQERAALKEAHLVSVITGLLVSRSVGAEDAGLGARTAWGVLSVEPR